MRRKEFISKKLAVVLMAATMVITPIVGSVAAPVESYAAGDVLADWETKSITGTFEFIPDNAQGQFEEEISNDEAMWTNDGTVGEANNWVIHNTENGTIDHNNALGIVVINDGSIGDNSGDVGYNSTTSEIDHNNGMVCDNDGHINYNYGYVNNGSGVVDYNSSWVLGSPITNYDKNALNDDSVGRIIYNVDGNIVNGVGENDELTVDYFYSGKVFTEYPDTNDESLNGMFLPFTEGAFPRYGKVHILNSLSDEEYKDNDLVQVDEQFHGIFFDGIDNVTAIYTDENGETATFARGVDGNTSYVNGAAVHTATNEADIPIRGYITIKANDGYNITDDGQMSGEVGKLSYSLGKNEDGSYTVNIDSLHGTVSLTPEMLHLIVSQLTGDEATTEVKIGDTTVKLDEIKDDEVIVISGGSDNSNSGTPAEASAPAGYNLTDAAIKNITDQVQKQVAANGNDIAALEVIDIYFGDKIDMTPGAIKYLCEKVPVAKRCHFDYKDQEYVMFIPAFDLVAPAYAEGLEVLNNEPAHTAGFLRITQIFEKLGFATKVVEEQEAAE